ncbi:MAG: hypothetical protein ABI068_01030 [Ktedonobacterales bacterium]
MAFTGTDVALIGIAVALFQTLLLAVAGFVAWSQWREQAKARYLEGLVRIFEDFGSREAYADADAVLGLPQRIEEYTAEELELATWAVRVYEKIAFLVDSELIPAEYIIPLYSRRIVWDWDALQPYIKEQRRLRDSDGGYRLAGDALYFERLAARALTYRKRTFKEPQRAHPPIPAVYRERLRATITRGERIGSRGLLR